jgi:putative peptidoglycan lipid II flippase
MTDASPHASESAGPTEGSPEVLGAGVRTVSGLTLASRVLGLGRDLITVRMFGDTLVGSAFAAAFAIPNLFRRLFGEGALSAAFLPAYSKLARSDPAAARALARLTLIRLALVTGVIMLAVEVVLGTIVVLVPSDGSRTLSLGLVMATMPFMPLICTAAILGGMLQAHGRFAPWAAAPIILNVCLIAVGLGYFAGGRGDPVPWAFGLAGAAVLSGVLQVVWSLAALRAHTAPIAGPAPDVRVEGREMLRRFVPAAIGLGTLQINALVDTLIAMWPVWVGPTLLGRVYPLDEASNAILFYSQRLYQFPLGVFGIAVATVAFPALSRAADDPSAFVGTLRRGVRLSLFIGIPASVGLWLVGEDLVRTLLTGGDGFTDDGVVRAVAVLTGYAAAVWAYSMNQILVRAFYALGDTATPVRIAALFVGVNLVLNLVLIWYFREAGMAWATAVSAIGQTAALAIALRARRSAEPLLDRAMIRSIGKMLLAAAVMGIAVWLVSEAVGARTDWARHAIALAAMTIGGAGVYAGVTARLGLDELRELIGRGA